MRKIIVALVAVAVLAAMPATASAGWWLSVPRGKSAIKAELRTWQYGSNFQMKLSSCYKPGNDRVRCFWQTREWDQDEYTWMVCYGTANARERYGWTSVALSRGWINDCFYTDSPYFV